MKPHLVEFYASSPVGLRAQAVEAVNDALSRGSTLLILGLDNLSTLDDAALSATIVALRRLREAGGTVALITQSVAHRKRLVATGLDRIFDVFATAEEARGRNERRQGTDLSRVLGARVRQVVAATFLSAIHGPARTPGPNNGTTGE
jgi:anti-anti-sigma regulatory factor